MKYRQSHYHHHHHHHFGNAGGPGSGRPDGFIKGTIRRLAEALNVSFKMVVLGFVLLFLFTGFFALLVFLVAAHWVRHPQTYDAFFESAFEKSREAFRHMTGKDGAAEASMAAGSNSAYTEDDFDFSDLDRQFDDLKRRTSGMEEHVASEDYKLNKAFRDLK